MAANAVDSLRASDLADVLTHETVEAWLAADPGLAVILFAGSSKGRIEGHDAAVALRECARSWSGQFRLAVASDEDEAKLMTRFRAVVLPSVVFLAGGAVVEVMPRLRDWAEYADAFRRYLGAPPAAVA